MVHAYPYEEALTTALANFIVNSITSKLNTQEKFTIALSGGNTPKNLYRKLASPAWSSSVAWEKVHVFWGDERFVPFGDEKNNAKMAIDVFLDKVPIPKANIHRMRTDIDIKKSAVEYEQMLKSTLDKSFDLVLVGLGDDGHTLSLFPGSEALKSTGWVTAVEDAEPKRISLTAEIVNHASQVIFLATGEKKAQIFHDILSGQNHKYPAALIKPINGELHWFVDKAITSFSTGS